MGLTLVTGAAGFIGSNVARKLCTAGRDVVGCDRMRSGNKWRNLVNVPLYDLIVPEALPEWLNRHGRDVDAIVHLGAVSATTETDVDRITRDNIRLTIDLWEWCARLQVPLIYASSAATYGDGSSGFDDDQSTEALAALRPMNAYGWSKHMVDRRILTDVHAVRAVPPQWAGLKFFNVYGPGEDHKGEMRSLVNKLIPKVRAQQDIELFRSYRPDYMDGGQMRDFVHVDDVVDAIAWLLTMRSVSGLFNIGSGAARTWNALAAAVSTALGQPLRTRYIDMPEPIRPHYQYWTQANMRKLRTAGWSGPSTSLEDGVARYVEAWSS